jgi:hypothetical protein
MKTVIATMGFLMGMIGLFGIGILAMNIGQTWDARNTDALVTGMVAMCAGSAGIVGLVLALVVGVPLGLRAYESSRAQRPPAVTVYPQPGQQQLPGYWTAPQLGDSQMGSWQRTGQYDLWDEQAAPQPQEGQGRRWTG